MPGHITLTDCDLEEMLAELQQDSAQQAIGTHYRADDGETAWTLHQSFGKWANHSFHLREYLTLTLTEWDFQENLSFNVNTQVEPLFGFNFCMSGGFIVKPSGSTQELVSQAMKRTLAFFKEMCNLRLQ